MRLSVAALSCGLAAASLSVCFVDRTEAEDWLRFRGPNGSGICPDDVATPVRWSETENLKWTAELPGPGLSSPIIVGDKVFLTCWSGYAVDARDPGEQENLQRHLICLDRQTGAIVWNKTVPAVLPEERYGGMFAENGYASHTPVSDGERVYAFFGKSGVHAFDLEGKKLWQAAVGTDDDRRGWGTASSPILFKNLLIVPATIESHSLVALDKLTGKEVWRQEAEGFGSTWGTPVLVELPEGRTDLVIAVPFEVWGLNPETGKLRWFCESVNSDSMCSSAVVDGDIVYVVEGRDGGAVAVRAGGEGDVTKTHVVWSGRQRGRIGTPVVADGRLYWVSSGIVNCVDAAKGEEIYRERIERTPSVAAVSAPQNLGGGARFGGGRFGGGPGGQDYSSPVVADGKLYYITRSGDMIVVRLGDEFEQLACNRINTDSGEFNATPAISDGELFIRSTTRLYCVREGK